MTDYSHMPWGPIPMNTHGLKTVRLGWMNRAARRAAGERCITQVAAPIKRISGSRKKVR